MRERGKNPEYRRIITGKRWGKLRNLKMLKNVISNGGYCEKCVRDYKAGGPRPRKATEVHHIIPIESAATREEMEALAYNEDNLEALCSECHRIVHRKMGKGHINEAHRHRPHRRLSKEQIKQERENDINDYIDRIKNGI